MKSAKIQAILFFSYRRSLKVIIYMVHVKIKATYPFSQVVGQNEISGEGVWKGRIELQHFLQGISLNHMKITVSQSPYISTGLGEGRLLPEHITKNVSFA